MGRRDTSISERNDMTTSVAAAPAREGTGTVAPARWYRDRNRQMIVLGVVVAAIALVVWFVVSSNERKEEFAARSLDVPTPQR